MTTGEPRPGYGWDTINPPYATWEDEIAAAHTRGMELVPADEIVPSGVAYFHNGGGAFILWRGIGGGFNKAAAYHYPVYRKQPGEAPATVAVSAELENLITWAKTACEEMRAQVGWPDDPEEFIPSWLPELENAVNELEQAQS